MKKLKNKDSYRIWLVKIPLALAVIGILFSVFTLLDYLSEPRKKTGLQVQIKEVESAINNLQNLENYLKKTKDEMIATKQAKDRIEEEYSKVKELKKLTNQQIEAISLAVNKRTKIDVLMNYFSGFVLGVAGSLVASFIYGLIKRKRKST